MTTGRKIALIGASIAGLLVVGLFGLHYYLRASAARYRAELVRKGEKLKISEVLPQRAPPESNGAPALKMAAAQLPRGAQGSAMNSVGGIIAFVSIEYARVDLDGAPLFAVVVVWVSEKLVLLGEMLK